METDETNEWGKGARVVVTLLVTMVLFGMASVAVLVVFLCFHGDTEMRDLPEELGYLGAVMLMSFSPFVVIHLVLCGVLLPALCLGRRLLYFLPLGLLAAGLTASQTPGFFGG